MLNTTSNGGSKVVKEIGEIENSIRKIFETAEELENNLKVLRRELGPVLKGEDHLLAIGKDTDGMSPLGTQLANIESILEVQTSVILDILDRLAL